MIKSSISSSSSSTNIKTPYKKVGVYNHIEAKEYFDERSDLFIKRFVEIAFISTSFGIIILLL